jgi:hypothetical protein
LSSGTTCASAATGRRCTSRASRTAGAARTRRRASRADGRRTTISRAAVLAAGDSGPSSACG